MALKEFRLRSIDYYQLPTNLIFDFQCFEYYLPIIYMFVSQSYEYQLPTILNLGISNQKVLIYCLVSTPEYKLIVAWDQALVIKAIKE